MNGIAYITDGVATLENGDLTCNSVVCGAATVSGALSLGGAATVSGALSLGGAASISGAPQRGRQRRRLQRHRVGRPRR